MDTFYEETEDGLLGTFSQPGNLETGEPAIIINVASDEELQGCGPLSLASGTFSADSVERLDNAIAAAETILPAHRAARADQEPEESEPNGEIEKKFSELELLVGGFQQANLSLKALAKLRKERKRDIGRKLLEIQVMYSVPGHGDFVARAMRMCGKSMKTLYSWMAKARQQSQEALSGHLERIAENDKDERSAKDTESAPSDTHAEEIAAAKRAELEARKALRASLYLRIDVRMSDPALKQQVEDRVRKFKKTPDGNDALAKILTAAILIAEFPPAPEATRDEN